MALVADNVLAGVTGAVYVAPTGSTLPTTAAASLDAAFIDLGYVSEDGVTESYSDETQEFKAWQSGVTVRRVITGSTASFAFTLVETKEEVLELYHKGSAIESDGGTGYKMNVTAPTADKRAFVIDVVDGTKEIRIVLPEAEVSERGEIVYQGGQPVGYSVTVTAYPTTQGGTANVVAIKLSGDTAWS